MAWEYASEGVNFGTHFGGSFTGKPNFLRLPNGYIALGADYEYTTITEQPTYVGPIISFYNIETGHLITPTYIINNPDSCTFESMDYLYDGDDLIVVASYRVTNINHKLFFFWYNFGTGAFGKREMSLGSSFFFSHTANVLGIFGRYLFFTLPIDQNPSNTTGFRWFCYRAYSIDILAAINSSSTITPVLRYITYNVIEPGNNLAIDFPQRAGRLPSGQGVCYMPFGGTTPRSATSDPVPFNHFITILDLDGSITVYTQPGFEASWINFGLDSYGSSLFIPTPRVTMVDPSNGQKLVTIFSTSRGGDSRGVTVVYTKPLWSTGHLDSAYYLRNSEETIQNGFVPRSAAIVPFRGRSSGPYGSPYSWSGSFQQSFEDSWIDGIVSLFSIPVPLTPEEEAIIDANTNPEIQYTNLFRAVYNSGGPYTSLKIDYSDWQAEFIEEGFFSAYYEWLSKIYLGLPPSLDAGEEGRLLRYYRVGEGMFASASATARVGKKIRIGLDNLPYDFYDTEVDGLLDGPDSPQPVVEVYGDVFKYGEDYYMIRTQRYVTSGVSGGYGTFLYRFTESNRESLGYII